MTDDDLIPETDAAPDGPRGERIAKWLARAGVATPGTRPARLARAAGGGPPRRRLANGVPSSFAVATGRPAAAPRAVEFARRR